MWHLHQNPDTPIYYVTVWGNPVGTWLPGNGPTVKGRPCLPGSPLRHSLQLTHTLAPTMTKVLSLAQAPSSLLCLRVCFEQRGCHGDVTGTTLLKAPGGSLPCASA